MNLIAGIGAVALLFSTLIHQPAVAADYNKKVKTGGEIETVYLTDGYVMAWFMYWLQGDEQAGNAFFGETAELLQNPLYQNAACSSGTLS